MDPAKPTSCQRLLSGGFTHFPFSPSSPLFAWTSLRALMDLLSPLSHGTSHPCPRLLLWMKGCKSPLGRHFEGWLPFGGQIYPEAWGLSVTYPTPSGFPSTALCQRSPAGEGRGGLGWRFPRPGAATCRQECVVWLGQEVLQVWGVGWGVWFDLVVRRWGSRAVRQRYSHCTPVRPGKGGGWAGQRPGGDTVRVRLFMLHFSVLFYF